MHCKRAHLPRFRRRDTLVVDRTFPFWVANRVAAIDIRRIDRRLDQLRFHAAAGTFANVYVIEWLNRPARARLADEADPAIPAVVFTEPVAEKTFSTGHIGRIRRVTRIAGPEPFPLAAPGSERWIEHLP